MKTFLKLIFVLALGAALGTAITLKVAKVEVVVNMVEKERIVEVPVEVEKKPVGQPTLETEINEKGVHVAKTPSEKDPHVAKIASHLYLEMRIYADDGTYMVANETQMLNMQKDEEITAPIWFPGNDQPQQR